MSAQRANGGVAKRSPAAAARARQKPDVASHLAEGLSSRSRRLSSTRYTLPGWQQFVQRETDAAFGTLRRNAIYDLVASILLVVLGLAALGIAIGYTIIRGDDMVGVLLDDQSPGLTEERLVALTLPVIMLVILATVSLAWSWAIQSRGGRDFARNLEAVSRLRREAEGGVSRTRTSTHALEEYYSNSRRAFRLQLWLSRTLFVVCLVLFATAVVDAILRHVDLATLALGVGSVLSLVLASVTGASTRVGTHLADTTQIQLVVGGATRQVNVLEDHMYEILESGCDPATAADAVREGTNRVSEIVQESLALIQRYAEPPNESEKQGG